ncbi:uncharacterized protein BDZ99DRAFT_460266 [Mytilinidion resinicola]|uniref:Uncharacterized protein n=1 Tax=Mytilinidion resinicola TaxID=574789 RepID=A0A6A6YVF5_9PEZI|nr:uncharacterized protein BDZ99DRAFT_460266 [Mytilinidion resinicola]KAF2812936.1 hypothetical protein BDZ99DRAFT_460266 [Mytilinidion resinicola]
MGGGGPGAGADRSRGEERRGEEKRLERWRWGVWRPGWLFERMVGWGGRMSGWRRMWANCTPDYFDRLPSAAVVEATSCEWSFLACQFLGVFLRRDVIRCECERGE